MSDGSKTGSLRTAVNGFHVREGGRRIAMGYCQMSFPDSFVRSAFLFSLALILFLLNHPAWAQTTPSASTPATVSGFLELPKSRNPFSAYSPSQVPQPQLTNSPRLDQLIRDGKLYLSLKDAIQLALENNL